MAYDYTLQTKLQSPTAANTRKVNADIRRSFSGFGIKFNNKDLKKATSEINKVGKAADDAGKKVKNFGDKIGSQGTSYLSYALVSGAIIRLTSAFASATNEAIKFEKELIKISQVTRKSTTDIIKNARVITDISREYGLATNKVAELTRLLAQTGLSFRQAADGARTLAKTELLASFDNLSDTTEGLIALMNSFNLSTIDAAKGLEAINAVSKRFAVESGDIVEAIKRTGGAFSAAGGDINELIALFTSVRATSRESGETIATAFRTIFGRLQRPKTIEYFKELNIELADANGNFVGGFAAIERISKGLKDLGIKAGSIKFAEVAEQVGGIRQLSKVIPLLTKFSDAQDALAVANAAASESEDDVAKAKKSLSFQIAALTADFRALIFEITQTAGFKIVATLFIETARAAIDLTRALKPLLPIFAAIGAFKGFGIASRAFNNFQGVKQQAQGFNRGGPVPGSGNGDTVPAMLEPGEFVIRKSAVQAYGTQNLANINKYKAGGKSKKATKANQIGSTIRDKSLGRFYDINNSGVYDYQNVNIKKDKTPSSRDSYRKTAEDIWNEASGKSKDEANAWIEKKTGGFSQNLGVSELAKSNNSQQRFNKIAGGLAEWDVFKSRPRLKKLKDSRGPDFLAPGGKYIEVKTNKRSVSNNVLLKKALLGTAKSKRALRAPFKNKRKDLVSTNLEFLQAFNKGGAVGTDTVPALLTPGEFVINNK
jgi:TP901 family phage tail tape measure protein